MRTNLRVAAAVAVLLAAAACGRQHDRDVLARVGGSSLTVGEFYASVPEHLSAVMTLDDQEEALKRWVKTELFYQEGLRRGLGKSEETRRRLRELEREIVAEACIQLIMGDVPDVTEEDARAYFEAHRSEYGLQVRLAHILVRSRQEAELVLRQLSAGTPFGTAAGQFSIDQTARIGGDLGYMGRGDMIYELEEVAFELGVGKVSGVIPSSYGYHIVKVLDRQPGAGQPTFESRRATVLNFLTSQRRRQVFDRWLGELQGRSTVVVDTANLRRAAQSRARGEEPGGILGIGAPQDTAATETQ
ncbi:MAG: peptidylprolyl isomerase [Candidatus Eisenbacteria bacterium]|nr:peptidylprolyl isomerase [Candidatus Eisenbacteria bacterium]